MARRTVFVDDITGKEIEDGKGGPVTFSIRGEYFELDLGEDSQAKLDKALAPFIDKAQKVPAPHAAVPARSAPAPRRSGGQPARTDKEQLQAMREWLRGQGHDVSDRGRIAGNLQELYNQAHTS